VNSAQCNYAQRNDGVQRTNNGVSAAPSGTFNLERKTTPPGPSHNQQRLRANTQGEATAQTFSTSVDVNKSVEENDKRDLTELDIEEGEGLEEYKDVDKEEEEEDDVEEEANQEEELVSSQDMEHSVIVVAPCSSQFTEYVSPWSDRSTLGITGLRVLTGQLAEPTCSMS
jgi:hypothetical protein